MKNETKARFIGLVAVFLFLFFVGISFAMQPPPACEDNILQVALNKIANNAGWAVGLGILIFLADGRKEGIGFVGVIGILLAAIGMKFLLGM